MLVPNARFNDVVGEIGYLEEFEHRYGLTRGVLTGAPERLYEQVRVWLAYDHLKEEWARRRRMLDEKVDLTDFMLRFVGGYLESAREATGTGSTAVWAPAEGAPAEDGKFAIRTG